MDPNILVRPYEPRDLDRILAIERDAFGADAWNKRLFVEYSRRCPDCFLIAKRQRRIAGYCITCTDSRDSELVSIAVDPRDVRHGVGRALLEETHRLLRASRAKTWWLMVENSNLAAIAFYERYGFKRAKTAKGYYGRGRDAWRMRRAVTATATKP